MAGRSPKKYDEAFVPEAYAQAEGLPTSSLHATFISVYLPFMIGRKLV
jgi:hypothetical protein